MSNVRLQVALADAGVASRRKAAELIESGSVAVNGRVVTEKGFRVDPSKDAILVNGKAAGPVKKLFYYVLNKPMGVISAASSGRGEKTVLDLIKNKPSRLYPAGRLDKNTTGLILITNDGSLTYHLTHPKFGVERVYEAVVKGEITAEERRRLLNGVVIDGKLAQAKIVSRTGSVNTVRITLCEGRKREVRRMCEKIGHEVVALKRIAYGPLELGGLKEGEYRELTKEELRKLKI